MRQWRLSRWLMPSCSVLIPTVLFAAPMPPDRSAGVTESEWLDADQTVMTVSSAASSDGRAASMLSETDVMLAAASIGSEGSLAPVGSVRPAVQAQLVDHGDVAAGSDVKFEVTNTQLVMMTSIPEPANLALLATCMPLMMRRPRRA